MKLQGKSCRSGKCACQQRASTHHGQPSRTPLCRVLVRQGWRTCRRVDVSNLTAAVQVVEGRLFSEGLHVLGQPPGEAHMRQYLQAYFDGGLPGEAVDALVAAGTASVDTVRQRLERSFEQVRHI